MKQIIGYDLSDVLDSVGLARKRTVIGVMLPALAFVAAGAALGVGAGLFFAPASGRRLRNDLRQGVSGRLGEIRARIQKERNASSVNSAIAHNS
jgi:hypothetical protein